jgi:hypothetical protein
MNSREAFEAWAKGAKLYGRDMAPGAWDAWQAAERQALERAAQKCDEISADRWNLFKGRAPYSGSEEGRASDYAQGESDGAEACAAVIRALIAAQSGEEK